MTQAYTHRFTEVHEIEDYLVPAVKANAVYTTAYVSLANHQRVFYILITGTMVTNATVDLQIWQATDAEGTGAKVIAGKAITQLTEADGDGDDICGIEVRTEELDVDGDFSYVAAILTIGTANCAATLLPLYGCSNYTPVPVANWTEIID